MYRSLLGHYRTSAFHVQSTMNILEAWDACMLCICDGFAPDVIYPSCYIMGMKSWYLLAHKLMVAKVVILAALRNDFTWMFDWLSSIWYFVVIIYFSSSQNIWKIYCTLFIIYFSIQLHFNPLKKYVVVHAIWDNDHPTMWRISTGLGI